LWVAQPQIKHKGIFKKKRLSSATECRGCQMLRDAFESANQENPMDYGLPVDIEKADNSLPRLGSNCPGSCKASSAQVEKYTQMQI
jgi:hypothetical protein